MPIFPFPKPIELIKRFISISAVDNDIVLDFFAAGEPLKRDQVDLHPLLPLHHVPLALLYEAAGHKLPNRSRHVAPQHADGFGYPLLASVPGGDVRFPLGPHPREVDQHLLGD